MKYNLFLWVCVIFLVVDLILYIILLRIKYKIKQLKKFNTVSKISGSCARYVKDRR